MSPFLLAVYRGSVEIRRGTGWFLTPDRVITAFHVVGTPLTGEWLHEREPCAFRALLPSGPVELQPGLADPRADVAVLVAPPGNGAGTALAEAVASAPYVADGFPNLGGTSVVRVSGKVVAARGTEGADALQLLVEQGTDVRWDGISGAPVMVGETAVGVLTRVTDGANTGWAASSAAISGLIRAFEAGDLVTSLRALLARLYPEAALAALLADLGASEPGGAPLASLDALLDEVRRTPEAGTALLDAMAANHPGDPTLRLLRARHRPRRASRQALARDLADRLVADRVVGMAVLAPFGFGTREIVNATVQRLASGRLPPIVVPMSPDRRAGDAELYPRLARDLRRGLQRAVGDPLPPAWARCLREAPNQGMFEDILQDLVSGPVAEERRSLVLVVDEMERLPPGQIEGWARIMRVVCLREACRLLVTGGQALHELCHGVGEAGEFSVFHELERREVGALDEGEVRELVRARGGSSAAATALHRRTAGHPALVRELAERPDWSDEAGVNRRVLASMHLRALRQRLAALPEARSMLAALQAAPDGRLERDFPDEGERLRWLGIVVEADDVAWTWAAPALRGVRW